MNMKFKLSLLLLLVLISPNFYSQTHEIGAGLQNLTSDSPYTSGTWINSRISTVRKGTTYYFENWNTFGYIVNSEEKRYKIKGLNYDTKADRILAKISPDSVYIFPKEYINKAVINNVVFEKIKSSDNNLDDYYEVIFDGLNLKLLKKSEKTLKEGNFNPLTQTRRDDFYITEESYYTYKENSKLKKIKMNKKNLIGLFGNKEDIIKKFISENHLSVKKDSDLKRIFRYYKTLSI